MSEAVRVAGVGVLGACLALLAGLSSAPQSTPRRSAERPALEAPAPGGFVAARPTVEAASEGFVEDEPPVGPSKVEMDRAVLNRLAAGDDLSDGLDLPPPGRAVGPFLARPESVELTEQDLADRRSAELDVLERTMVALEAELIAAEAAGDEQRAHLLWRRIERSRRQYEGRRDP